MVPQILREEKRKRKELGSQSLGLSPKPPMRPHLQNLVSVTFHLCLSGDKAFSPRAFEGHFRSKLLASLTEPKPTPGSIINTWLLNANACLIIGEK